MKVEIDLTEKEFQDLMTIWLMRYYNRTKVEIFREITIGYRNADIVIFSPYYPGQIVVYELKMFNDKDKNRLNSQLKSYSMVADNIYVACFGKPLSNLPDHVGSVVCNIRDGRFNVDHLSNRYVHNPRENINWEYRKRSIQTMIKMWRSKANYAEKCYTHSYNKHLKELKIKEKLNKK